MPTATWNDVVIATADEADVELVEGNVYFPSSSLRNEHFVASDHTSICPWKGTAHYYHVEAGGQRNENAAWHYPKAKDAAANIEGFVAFWKGVRVEA